MAAGSIVGRIILKFKGWNQDGLESLEKSYKEDKEQLALLDKFKRDQDEPKFTNFINQGLISKSEEILKDPDQLSSLHE